MNVGLDGLGGHAGEVSNVHDDGAEVGDEVGAPEVVVASAASNDGAHVDSGEAGQVRARGVGEVHVADGGDGFAHIGDGVYCLLLAADVAGVA